MGYAKPPYKQPWQRGCCVNPPQKKAEAICHHCNKVLPKHIWDFLLKVKIWPRAVQFYTLALGQNSNREFIIMSSERDNVCPNYSFNKKLPQSFGRHSWLLTKTAEFISPDELYHTNVIQSNCSSAVACSTPGWWDPPSFALPMHFSCKGILKRTKWEVGGYSLSNWEAVQPEVWICGPC